MVEALYTNCLHYDQPLLYRRKMPKYAEEGKNFEIQAKNMTKQTLKVKKDIDVEGIKSISGASGITSMLTRAHNGQNKRMNFK